MERMRDDSCGSTAVFPIPMLQRTKSSVVLEAKKKGILLKQKESIFNHQSA